MKGRSIARGAAKREHGGDERRRRTEATRPRMGSARRRGGIRVSASATTHLGIAGAESELLEKAIGRRRARGAALSHSGGAPGGGTTPGGGAGGGTGALGGGGGSAVGGAAM